MNLEYNINHEKVLDDSSMIESGIRCLYGLESAEVKTAWCCVLQ